MLALTHIPSPSMQACVRTYIESAPINVPLAVQQHAAYCTTLRACGASVRVLHVNRDLPDCAFLEDNAVILDEVAILCRPGALSRQREPAGIEPALAEYRKIIPIEPPATLEGGDVLRIGQTLLVGRSSRTNSAGIEQLTAIGRQFGYEVKSVEVQACLHLKTACTALPTPTRRASEGVIPARSASQGIRRPPVDNVRLLINPNWLDTSTLHAYDLIPIPADEPWAANIAWIGQSAILPATHHQTAAQIQAQGFDIRPVDLSEFNKAEGGPTCLSLLFE